MLQYRSVGTIVLASILTSCSSASLFGGHKMSHVISAFVQPCPSGVCQRSRACPFWSRSLVSRSLVSLLPSALKPLKETCNIYSIGLTVFKRARHCNVWELSRMTGSTIAASKVQLNTNDLARTQKRQLRIQFLSCN